MTNENGAPAAGAVEVKPDDLVDPYKADMARLLKALERIADGVGDIFAVIYSQLEELNGLVCDIRDRMPEEGA